MRDPWIKDCGTADQSAAFEMLGTWKKEHTGATVLCFFTDRFVPNDSHRDADHLLELRAFDGNAELWIHRSCIGQPFVWREADDLYLLQAVSSKAPAFFADGKNYMVESVQKLDIDLHAKPSGCAPEGCKLLQTTGGRVYSLPVTSENAVRLIGYMNYDDQGVATLRDFRYAGFITRSDFGKEAEAE